VRKIFPKTLGEYLKEEKSSSEIEKFNINTSMFYRDDRNHKGYDLA